MFACVRHHHHIVLVDTLCAQPSRRQNPRDRERHILDTQNLTDRIVVSVNLRRSRVTNDTNFVCAAHVLWGERRAIGERPLPEIEIIGRFAVNSREPILISRRHLCGRGNFFAHRGNPRHLTPNRLGIFDFQRSGAAPPGPDPARSCAAGKNQDHILPETRDLRFHQSHPSRSRRRRQ